MKAECEADWRSGQRKQLDELDREVWDVYADVGAEQVVSGIRHGSETQREFSGRIAQEEPWPLHPRLFERRAPEPEADPEPELPF